MTRSPPWSQEENVALCALYFSMLDKAIAGEAYNKAAMIRSRQLAADDQPGYCPPLAARNRGSIEAKLMNASAAHRDIDPEAETMATRGYKAWGNYQAALKDAMRDKIETRRRCYIGSDGRRYA